jgi:hypothetical protein
VSGAFGKSVDGIKKPVRGWKRKYSDCALEKFSTNTFADEFDAMVIKRLQTLSFALSRPTL